MMDPFTWHRILAWCQAHEDFPSRQYVPSHATDVAATIARERKRLEVAKALESVGIHPLRIKEA
jgi:hypothetical protein